MEFTALLLFDKTFKDFLPFLLALDALFLLLDLFLFDFSLEVGIDVLFVFAHGKPDDIF